MLPACHRQSACVTRSENIVGRPAHSLDAVASNFWMVRRSSTAQGAVGFTAQEVRRDTLRDVIHRSREAHEKSAAMSRPRHDRSAVVKGDVRHWRHRRRRRECGSPCLDRCWPQLQGFKTFCQGTAPLRVRPRSWYGLSTTGGTFTDFGAGWLGGCTDFGVFLLRPGCLTLPAAAVQSAAVATVAEVGVKAINRDNGVESGSSGGRRSTSRIR